MSSMNNPKETDRSYCIAVDFDGTIVTHEYPRIGKLLPGALETIRTLQRNGHQVFLYTMRSHSNYSDSQGSTIDGLQDAIDYLESVGLKLDGYNQSPQQIGTSTKQFAHVYIDDSALGTPLYRYKGKLSVDWRTVAMRLYRMELITNEQYTMICQDINATL